MTKSANPRGPCNACGVNETQLHKAECHVYCNNRIAELEARVSRFQDLVSKDGERILTLVGKVNALQKENTELRK